MPNGTAHRFLSVVWAEWLIVPYMLAWLIYSADGDWDGERERAVMPNSRADARPDDEYVKGWVESLPHEPTPHASLALPVTTLRGLPCPFCTLARPGRT